MTWTCEYEDRLFTMNDEEMVDHLIDEYRHNNLEIGQAFAEWVNEIYTPWDAMNTDMEFAMRVWAQHLVQNRQDLVEGLVPWAHCKEVRE